MTTIRKRSDGESDGWRSPEIRSLLISCPFLETRVDLSNGSYAIMATVALMVRDRELTAAEIEQVLEGFNRLAEREGFDEDLLRAGALEILNDDRDTRQLARTVLRGRALELLEKMRALWGRSD